MKTQTEIKNLKLLQELSGLLGMKHANREFAIEMKRQVMARSMLNLERIFACIGEYEAKKAAGHNPARDR